MKSWYLIHTKPRQEKIAESNLTRQGYRVYLPLAASRRRSRGKLSRIISPMFPRYLFIHLSDQTDDWRPIRSTLGVATLVMFGQAPARIPDVLIDDLHNRESTEGVLEVEPASFRQGEKVRIAEGPLVGYEGIFQCKSGKERVVLLLDIAQKFVRIELPADGIEPV